MNRGPVLKCNFKIFRSFLIMPCSHGVYPEIKMCLWQYRKPGAKQSSSKDVLVGYRMKEEAKGSQQQILLGILNYNYAPYLDHNV